MALIRPHRKQLGRRFSEGSRLLWTVIEERGWTQTHLCSVLGNPAGMQTTWLFGDRKPGRKWANAIYQAFGIDQTAWDSPPTETFVPPAARVKPRRQSSAPTSSLAGSEPKPSRRRTRSAAHRQHEQSSASQPAEPKGDKK